MEEIFNMLNELQEKIGLLEMEAAELRKENAELRARLGATKAEPEPLKVYDRVEDIIWERGQHTANSYALQQFFGKKHDLRPWKQVIVKDVGQVYRSGGNQVMPDWYAIAHHRVLDVTANPWVCLVQEGDDAWESDRDDMERLVREYRGGLRHHINTWDDGSLGSELKQIYLETHDDTGPEMTRRPIPVTPAG